MALKLQQIGLTVRWNIIARFFKYAFLLTALGITIVIVFDGFSYYYARRSLDDELASKKISSLEYLTVLRKQNRAIVLASLETRCTERNELAVIRSIEAGAASDLNKAYAASFEVKNAIIDYLDHKLEPAVAGKIDIDRLKKEVNKATFTMARLESVIFPANGVPRDNSDFRVASHALSTALQDVTRDEQAALARYADKFTALQDKFGANGSVLKNVDVLEQRLNRLNQEKQKIAQKLGDIDDVLARYAIWTDAISGAEIDNPVLDEMAYRLEDENKSSLLDAPCKALEQYYSKVNGQPFKIQEVVAYASNSGFRAVYSSLLRSYFEIPPIAQTLFVTLFLGALGGLTINVLRLSRIGWWAEQSEPLWGEIALCPFLGALAAFGIFLLGSTGLLLTGDIKSGSGGAVSLSAFFIGLLGFVSGLLYDEAFGRVRRFGVQLFGGDERPTGPSQMDSSLADTLRSAGYPLTAELALRTALGTTTAPLSEFTLLLPADDSLASSSLAQWTELTGSTPSPKLAGWRQHHISNKRLLSSDVLGSRSGGTTTELVLQEGTKLAVGFAIDGFTINDRKVVQPDIVWGNGVIHLLPADI